MNAKMMTLVMRRAGRHIGPFTFRPVGPTPSKKSLRLYLWRWGSKFGNLPENICFRALPKSHPSFPNSGRLDDGGCGGRGWCCESWWSGPGSRSRSGSGLSSPTFLAPLDVQKQCFAHFTELSMVEDNDGDYGSVEKDKGLPGLIFLLVGWGPG